MLNTTQIAFLKTLQERLKTQDHCGTAAPRYWTILDYQEVPADPSYEPETGFRLSLLSVGEEIGNSDDLEALAEYCIDTYEVERSVFYRSKKDLLPWQEVYNNLKEYIDNEGDSDFFLVPFVYAPVYSKEVFLTKEACENHLNRYSYRYSRKAQPYCRCAVDCEELKQLLEILETLDIDSVS